MKVIFRVDASLCMGIGHFMRCLTLADALRDRGVQVRFICREHNGHLIEKLSQKAIPVTVLHAPVITDSSGSENYAAWLGVSQAEDAKESIEALNKEMPDWLVVDHYGLDVEWEELLRPHEKRLMVVDDLANRRHDCDLLLDQNFGRHEQDYKGIVNSDCQLLIGPHYAILRPEFLAFRDYSLARRKKPNLKHLLISMGGIDPLNATGKVLLVLKSCSLPLNCHITVVMGSHAPWLYEVQKIAEVSPLNIEVKIDVSNMAQLMADSDMVIGAAGTTSWERCCLGVPSLIVVLAENQILAANALEMSSAAKSLRLDSLEQDLMNHFHDSYTLGHWLDYSARAAADICNGRGSEEVMAVLTDYLS